MPPKFQLLSPKSSLKSRLRSRTSSFNDTESKSPNQIVFRKKLPSINSILIGTEKTAEDYANESNMKETLSNRYKTNSQKYSNRHSLKNNDDFGVNEESNETNFNNEELYDINDLTNPIGVTDPLNDTDVVPKINNQPISSNTVEPSTNPSNLRLNGTNSTDEARGDSDPNGNITRLTNSGTIITKTKGVASQVSNAPRETTTDTKNLKGIRSTVVSENPSGSISRASSTDSNQSTNKSAIDVKSKSKRWSPSHRNTSTSSISANNSSSNLNASQVQNRLPLGKTATLSRSNILGIHNGKTSSTNSSQRNFNLTFFSIDTLIHDCVLTLLSPLLFLCV